MINAKQDKETDPLKRRDSITILIEGEEDHTVIDNPPGFPTKEELELMGLMGWHWKKGNQQSKCRYDGYRHDEYRCFPVHQNIPIA
ncbi:MAG: hypothetical protein IID45_13675 [Planctomycetes bacterium]|nr:hypothetical protein [Planctomycetota bacterium]